jgi:hypothetical protein
MIAPQCLSKFEAMDVLADSTPARVQFTLARHPSASDKGSGP